MHEPVVLVAEVLDRQSDGSALREKRWHPLTCATHNSYNTIHIRHNSYII